MCDTNNKRSRNLSEDKEELFELLEFRPLFESLDETNLVINYINLPASVSLIVEIVDALKQNFQAIFSSS